jgi:4-amino-4-deoxy-L-arabinose transferase-like glycosyltransferase
MKLKIIDFIKKNKTELVILGLILLVGTFFRLYKIGAYMTFLGDEGRDAIIVRRLFTELHPPLIGPGTSIGNMYLGPLYYYMMAIPLLVASFSPIGPAVQVALLGILTVAFVWWIGRIWFNKWVGLIAAALYAISPTVIIYSRSSWNPNIMPFFALLVIYSVWKVWREEKFNWLIVLGVSFAFVLQSHYIGLLLAPTIFIFWLLTLRNLKLNGGWKPNKSKFLQKSLLGILIFLSLMSPLVIFDARHNWMNFRAIYTFFTVRQETVSIRPWMAIPKIPAIFNLINTTLISGKYKTLGILISIFIFAGIAAKLRAGKIKSGYLLLVSWLGFALIGFGLYKQNIYDHYFGFIFAVPCLLIGIILSEFFNRGKLLKTIGCAIFIFLVGVNLSVSPLRKEPNRLLQRSKDVATKIVEEANGRPMNLAVIADTNYEAGYQYFVELYGGKVLSIDATKKETTADELFAVCELIPTSKCDPTHNPKAQIANFGWSKIAAQWELDGVIIYKLVHTR